MRLPTITQFRTQSQMLSSQFERLTYLQTQSVTGKKILRSSENPLLADNIKSVQDHLVRLNSFDTNLSLAESRQGIKESSVKESINIVNQIQELMMRAQNDTNNDSDRNAISKEVEGILSRIGDLANTRDSNGEYIFSGFNIHTPAFRKENGQYIYQGGDQISEIAIGLGVKVEYSDSGYQIFSAIPKGNGDFSVSADTVNNTGTGVLAGDRVIDFSGYVEDDYTVTIVTNSSGAPAIQVIGANSGQVIPVPPATSPADAPDYINGDSIVFNGVSIQLTGSPDIGDRFFVNPSQSQSIFSAISDLITVLNQPANTPKNKADLKQKLGELQQTVEQAATHFVTYQQKIGNQGIIIDNQRRLTENLQVNEKIFLNALSSANLEEVLTELSQQNIALQLTQKIYTQLQESQYAALRGS